MSSFARFFMNLGESVDLFRPIDFERFIPKELRGKSPEQRAVQLIAASYRNGIRQVSNRRPELSHVVKEAELSARRAI